jgi:hypothetical protein
MLDEPLPLRPRETNCRAPPHVELSSVSSQSAHMTETMGKGHVLVRGNFEVANFIINCSLERGEPLFSAFSRSI